MTTETLDIPNASIATQEKSMEDCKADEQTIRTDAAMNNSIPSTIDSQHNDNDMMKEDTKQQSNKDQQSLSNNSTSSQHKPTSTLSVDETKITKAISFLSSPSINNISTSDKRNYLQHKIGMTEQEIDFAFDKIATAKMDDVMKEQVDGQLPSNNDRESNRQNGSNHQQQYRDDPYNNPHQRPTPPSFQAQNNMQSHNMHQHKQNTQDMSPHSSSSAASIAGGFSLGIFALAAFRWLNGGDFILFPPPSTVNANGESTPVKTEEEESGVEGKKLMNINEDDTDESLEEEDDDEEEEDNEEFEEDEYEETITNLMSGTSSNAQSYHPTSSNQEDLPSYSELVSEIRTLTTAIQSYRNETERNNRIVHNKVGREMTNDAMNFLKKKKESEVIEDEGKIMKVLLMEVSADLVQIKQCIEVKTNSESTSDESKAGDNDGDIKEKVDTEADEEDTKASEINDDDKEADDKEGPLQRIDTALEKIQKMLTMVQKVEEPVKETSDAEGSSSSTPPQTAEAEEKEKLTLSKPPSPSSSPTPSTGTEEKAQDEPSSSPAQLQDQDDSTEQTDEQKQQQQLEEAIKTLSTSNKMNDLKAGSQMLYLYCLNISKNPTVPRYRKIYTNNNTFRNKVGKLIGAKEFLSAVGFVERTNCFEWDQGTDDAAVKSRLDFALVALELLKNGTVKPKVEEENEQSNDTVSELQQTEVSLSTPLTVHTDIDEGIDLN